jgi:hypothetical protein
MMMYILIFTLYHQIKMNHNEMLLICRLVRQDREDGHGDGQVDERLERIVRVWFDKMTDRSFRCCTQMDDDLAMMVSKILNLDIHDNGWKLIWMMTYHTHLDLCMIRGIMEKIFGHDVSASYMSNSIQRLSE